MQRLTWIVLAWLLVSCQEEVFLDLRNTEPIPIIEAVWTDVSQMNFVQLSRSRDFFDADPNEFITDAEVFIRNKRTNGRLNFRFSEQLGLYLPVNNFVGSINESYELNVRIGENEYQSEGTILPPPTLDSIRYEFRDQRFFREEGYYLTLYGDIPFVDDNFYRIRIIRNDTLLNSRTDYLLFDDTFGTNILNQGFELNVPFRANDRVRLELFRLNRDAYEYMNQLVSLLFNDGGLFSPPPQNPVSNIRQVKGKGMFGGYFKVSPVLIQNVVITPSEQVDN
ncbi:DUF4249 domain-containing protein [Mongoliitalea daihaiensis]|uniref:DUF4249 domain-containing protein n=1 Tax=Mongoliitalea daihaiensis TaxID=2782006 RepID=UPI001F178A3E|nr:DUF4249 domain-containing protein [Mongoliitalea daihaiensis]UJP63925.1 DUF4249 domain-containing protein [Mongoliitalea daihaiensis]